MENIDGRVLKDLREENGYSLREFAAMIYTSKSSVQRWEQSKLPENTETLNRIAEIFGKTTDELRCLSREKYGENVNQPDVEALQDDERTINSEQLSEIKLNLKNLSIPLILVAVLSALIAVAILFI